MRHDSYIAVEYCGVYSDWEGLPMPCAFGKRHLQRGDISILIMYVTWLALFGFSIICID
nr:MAG TPA: hypothetical protein [Caudoviricetes sp.]